MTNAEKLTKLSTKLSTVETKLREYQTQYNDITNEMQTVIAAGIGGSNTQSIGAAKTTKVAGAVSLGGRILTVLGNNTDGGFDLKQLANRLKVRPQQAGVAVSHLIRKHLVNITEGKYVISPVAAKTTPSIDLNEGTA